MKKQPEYTFEKSAQDSLPEHIKNKMKVDSEVIEKGKLEIDSLTHIEMCKMWRFGTLKPEWLDSSNPLSAYFIERLFQHFGGFTPEISKMIGW